MIKIGRLNESNHTEFIETLHDIFEHSPWVTDRAWEFRPFSSVSSLHERMVHVVKEAAREEQIALINEHPHLGTLVAISPSSAQEQKNAGLGQLSAEEYENFLSLNKEYVKKHGFPFIIAVRGKTKDEIYSAMKARVNHSQNQEFELALLEIYKIALFRLKEKITD